MGIGLILAVALGIVVIVCVVASFFVRRHRESDSPDPSWTRTSEMFNDPSTNRQMRVWLDRSGERHYVAEGHHEAT